MKTALIATMGVTPSVLASTVWELAVHPQEFLGEEASVIPDKIVVFGTTASKTILTQQLFNREAGKKLTGWEQLRTALEKRNLDIDGKLQFSKGNIITFSNEAGEEIDDIRNAKDCHCVANSIVKELRDLAVREDWRILASISGGRKPESALLLSCMNILGRDRDAVLHLVPLKWPTPTNGCNPPFLFPGQGAVHSKKDEKAKRLLKFKSEAIQFSLINIPFIRVRNCLPDLAGTRPLPSFEDLVSRSQRALDQSAFPEKPHVKFDFEAQTISLTDSSGNSTTIRLAESRFFLLACDLLQDEKDASEIFTAVRKGSPRKGEHPLLRAMRKTRVRDKGDDWENLKDFRRLRDNTKRDIIKKGGRFSGVAADVLGRGEPRKNPYPADLVSEEDRIAFRDMLNKVDLL